MPHLVMVIRGFLFLLIFEKKKTNKQTKIRMKIIQYFTTSTITQPLIPVSRIRPAAYRRYPFC